MMKKIMRLIGLCLSMLLILTACSLPFLTKATPAPEGTPNATLTALFDTSKIIASNTPPVIATVNELPTVDLSTATATLEPTYTSTVAPTATFTTAPTVTTAVPAPAQRANAQLVAKFLSTAPVQDGTYTEWVDYTNKYKAINVVWGAANYTNYADVEGVFAVAWDYTNLYIGAKVTDDTYTQKYTGHEIYLGDAVEILVDANLLGDFYNTGLTSDDFQFGFSAGNPSSSVAASDYQWYPSSMTGTPSKVTMSTKIESATMYWVEAAIPWSLLGVTPTNGMRLGFALNVDDNDNVSDYKHMTMVSSASGLSVFNPTTWGELVLSK